MLFSADRLDADLRRCAASLIGAQVTELEPVEGGANNRVFRVSAGGRRYALKLYPAGMGDARDRLGSESAALAFMRSHGLAMVPAYLAADRVQGIGLYEWVEGKPPGAARDPDISAALALIEALHRLRAAPEAMALPPASEACLSGAEIVDQIERRFTRLEQVAIELPALLGLLEGRIAPTVAAARARAEDAYAAAGLDFAAPIEAGRRTLSPSDFGFHNARRKADGTLVFIDFEYFGWDDPAKPVADFLLHPGMAMTDAQRRTFARGADAIYGGDPTFRARLEALYALFGLRWSLILLNEFLPERWARRVQAGMAHDRETVLPSQIAKAQAMLAAAQASIERFPYGA